MDCEGILSMSYETQHFGFHPRVFFDRIYNKIYETLFEGLNAMQDFLSEEYNHVTTAEAIKASTDALFQEMIKKLDKAVDKLELYTNYNVFMIPKHVVLPEDKVHITNPSTKEEDIKLDEEIEELKQKIVKERMWIAYLKSEIAQQKLVKDELLAFKIKLDQLLSSASRLEVTKENICSILNNCYELGNEMNKYRPKNSLDCNGFAVLESTSGDEEAG